MTSPSRQLLTLPRYTAGQAHWQNGLVERHNLTVETKFTRYLAQAQPQSLGSDHHVI